jgi:hypothetical protein
MSGRIGAATCDHRPRVAIRSALPVAGSSETLASAGYSATTATSGLLLDEIFEPHTCAQFLAEATAGHRANRFASTPTGRVVRRLASVLSDPTLTRLKIDNDGRVMVDHPLFAAMTAAFS